MEGQVRRLGSVGGEAPEVAGRRECQAEEAFGRGDARQRDAEGCRSKKMVTPAARREAVAHLRVAFEVSERRACSTLCSDRTSVRYRSRRPSDAAARSRLRELAAVRRRVGYRPRPHPPPPGGIIIKKIGKGGVWEEGRIPW